MVADKDIGSTRAFGEPLNQTFFAPGPLEVAPRLLGCMLVSTVDGVLTAGRIVEVEAYLGSEDPGSHASTRGVTKRNVVMYGPPGCAYVYFTYGNHFMFNLVCLPAGTAGAVLVRALEPIEGTSEMIQRRGRGELSELCSGPGKLTQALGIDLRDNGVALGEGRLQVYAGLRSQPGEVATSARIGLAKGHELPYRFFLAGSEFVSKGSAGRSTARKRNDTDRGGSNT